VATWALWRLHEAHGLRREQTHTIERGSITKMKAGVAELVDGSRGKTANGIGGAGERPGSSDCRGASALDMANSEPVCHHVAGSEERHTHAKRFEHQFTSNALVGPASDSLYDTASDVKARIVISIEHTKRRLLGQEMQPSDHAGEGVVARAGILEVVAWPTTGVSEEMAQRDAGSHVLGSEAQIRQIGANWSVQIKDALLNEAHGAGACDSLGG